MIAPPSGADRTQGEEHPMAEFHIVSASIDGKRMPLALANGVVTVHPDSGQPTPLSFKEALNLARLAKGHPEYRGVQIIEAA
jgi:hypothetical protein